MRLCPLLFFVIVDFRERHFGNVAKRRLPVDVKPLPQFKLDAVSGAPRHGHGDVPFFVVTVLPKVEIEIVAHGPFSLDAAARPDTSRPGRLIVALRSPPLGFRGILDGANRRDELLGAAGPTWEPQPGRYTTCCAREAASRV